MADFYATLAADGPHHRTDVVAYEQGPKGETLLENGTETDAAVAPEVARQATQALTKVVNDGTGRAAALPDRPVAGKTGTADNYQDAWFVGYTPDLATAVWFGDPNGEVPMKNVGGIAVVGGSYP